MRIPCSWRSDHTFTVPFRLGRPAPAFCGEEHRHEYDEMRKAEGGPPSLDPPASLRLAGIQKLTFPFGFAGVIVAAFILVAAWATDLDSAERLWAIIVAGILGGSGMLISRIGARDSVLAAAERTLNKRGSGSS